MLNLSSRAKKAVCALLCAILVIVAVTGCSSEDNNDNKPTSPEYEITTDENGAIILPWIPLG